MARKAIGQEVFEFSSAGGRNDLDRLHRVVEWRALEEAPGEISSGAKGQLGWPPLSLFKALFLSMWYDLLGVKLAEALNDRASFRRFCGFSKTEAAPERTAFVRFRKGLVRRDPGEALFDEIAAHLKARHMTVKV